MDARRFLAEFGHIANAPGGVTRLRELVLQLAVSGQLVRHIESNKSVDDEITGSNKFREAYEQKFNLRSSRLHPPIDQQPFTIPSHWRWVRFEQLALYIQRGKGPKYADKGRTYVVSQKCIKWAGFDLQQARKIVDDSLSSYGEERFLRAGDLLWNSTGTGTAGRMSIYAATEGVSAVADSHVTVIRLAIALPRYLWCVIATPWIQSRIDPNHPNSLVSGTTQQVELSTNSVRALPIPCPPTEEQSRIVAKVDELMALCDKLEAQQQERRALQNALRQTTLQAVSASAGPHELQTSWKRLAESFGRLFQAPEDVGDVRKLLVELAIRGVIDEPNKLGPEEHVDTLIANLHRRKDSKRFAKQDIEEEPFILPKSWRWVLLEDVLAGSESGWSPKCDAENRSSEEWGVLKVSAVTWGKFLADENKRLPASLVPRTDCEVMPGDFLLSRANTAELVARSVITPNDCPKHLMMSDKIIRLNFVDDALKA